MPGPACDKCSDKCQQCQCGEKCKCTDSCGDKCTCKSGGQCCCKSCKC